MLNILFLAIKFVTLQKNIMKKSKITKSNDPVKILRMISRNEQIERNGGGQFVAVNRIWKNKKKYDRKAFKKGLRDISQSFLFLFTTDI